MVTRTSIKGLIFTLALVCMAVSVFAQDHGAVAASSGSVFNKAFAVGLVCFGVAMGVAFVGYAAANATGRNPGAAGQVLTISIIAMAFVEAIAFYVMFLAELA